MKKYVIILICVLLSSIALGQDKSKELEEVQVTPPKFMGIHAVENPNPESNSLPNFVASHLNYFEENGFVHEGTIVAQFSVTANGDVADIQVTNKISPEIDRELIRILKTTNGMWIPGLNNGDPVPMQKEVALEIHAPNSDGISYDTDFQQKARCYFTKGTKNFLMKKNSKRALTYYNKGIRYKPYDKSLYFLRGLCRYDLGHLDGARQDWQRLKDLGGFDMIPMLAEYDLRRLKGYEEYTALFSEK